MSASIAPVRPLERLTLDGTLAAVAPHVPAALVPAPAWAAVRRAARALPAALTRAVYLECRLAHAAAPVDLILRVERDGAALLAGHNPAARLSPALREDPAWRAVAETCARWLADEGASGRCVSHLWLEFDLAADAPGAIPRPSLFAGLRSAAAVTDADARALLEWLGGLCGGLDAETRRTAMELISRRGPALQVPYIGVMASREVPAVRVYYRGPRADQVVPTLESAGWPGLSAPLADTIRALTAVPNAPGVGMLHVDVAGGPLPRAGVEFALARDPQLRGDLVETAFLERLVELGLCLPERRDALLAWPGARRCTLPHELWESVMVRRVNCIKLVSGPAAIEAKGYPLAFPHPAPGRRAPAAAAQTPSVPGDPAATPPT
ncbi:MAG TPA: hypothetical protein VFS20_16155 [Longimicrobium sp.]|nr:hypothetical protein [Longimicrobium sp.]